MKIIDTFVPGLRTFKFGVADELTRNMDLFFDPKYLYEFFEKKLDKFAFYEIESVKEAVELSLKQAEILEDKLLILAEGNVQLDTLFKNLNNGEYKATLLSKQKSSHRWLRLYAIKIEKNQYVITGGAIKLTEEMKDAKDTLGELQKLERCRDYLQDQHIYDLSTFNELILEE